MAGRSSQITPRLHQALELAILFGGSTLKKYPPLSRKSIQKPGPMRV